MSAFGFCWLFKEADGGFIEMSRSVQVSRTSKFFSWIEDSSHLRAGHCCWWRGDVNLTFQSNKTLKKETKKHIAGVQPCFLIVFTSKVLLFKVLFQTWLLFHVFCGFCWVSGNFPVDEASGIRDWLLLCGYLAWKTTGCDGWPSTLKLCRWI